METIKKAFSHVNVSFYFLHIECNSGTYGENCTYTCGECLDAVTCNHVNGTCPGGCKPGRQNTDRCDKRM